ncbi:MAG: thiamine phosphate synthase [Succinivibrionaceae bacterium]|nr:thiamine phosphate synthase [Succinivibrionaceae bacterium]
MKKVWTIAASDSGGGAGIERDLKTFADFKVHGCSVITALTCQNSRKCYAYQATDPLFFRQTMEHLVEDMAPDAVKIGLLPARQTATEVAGFLARCGRDGLAKPFVVYDPVLKPTAGGVMGELTYDELLDSGLLERIDLITPNLPELRLLCQAVSGRLADGRYQPRLADPERSAGAPEPEHDAKDATFEDIRAMAEYLSLHAGNLSVLVTGGHNPLCGYVHDVLFEKGEEPAILRSHHIDSSCKHGTGCAMSSAVAALMAQGHALRDAVTAAAMYVGKGIFFGYGAGSGQGTLASGFEHDDAAFLPLAVSSFEESPKSFVFPPEPRRLGLYPVVGSVEWIRRLLALGVKTIQLRIKDPQYPDLERDIKEAVRLGREYGARVYIDDYWELAIKHGAWGVHLGQEDLKTADLAAIAGAGLRLGVSTHGYFEIAAVMGIRPSYIALGHIFPTGTKKMKSKPQGVERLARYVRLTSGIPTVAIGGIKEDTLESVLATGVGSVAVVSLIVASAEPDAVTKQLMEKIPHDD